MLDEFMLDDLYLLNLGIGLLYKEIKHQNEENVCDKRIKVGEPKGFVKYQYVFY